MMPFYSSSPNIVNRTAHHDGWMPFPATFSNTPFERNCRWVVGNIFSIHWFNQHIFIQIVESNPTKTNFVKNIISKKLLLYIFWIKCSLSIRSIFPRLYYVSSGLTLLVEMSNHLQQKESKRKGNGPLLPAKRMTAFRDGSLEKMIAMSF